MPSKSKTQQRLMGVAYAVKSGDMQLSDVDTNYKDKVKDLVDGMSLKDLKDFAETKHDGLPEEIGEGISPANVGGMGPIQLPTDTQPGSGDVPTGTKSEDDEEDEKEEIKEMKEFIPKFEKFVTEAKLSGLSGFGKLEYTIDDLNLSYGWAGTLSDHFDNEDKAILLTQQAIKDLGKTIGLSQKEALGLLNSKAGRHMADLFIDGGAVDATAAAVKYLGNKAKVAKYAKETAASQFESVVNEDWGSSDQSIMNQQIHKDAGSPKKMPSPFDRKLRAAAEDAVDWHWEDWPEYKRDRDGLIDNAIRSYLRSYFPKDWAIMVRMFEPMESVATEQNDSAILEFNEEATRALAKEVSGELYYATLKNGAKSVTVKATTTKNVWDDDVPVLKYLARGKAKPVQFSIYRPFYVVHDVAHSWFYFTDGGKWYGLHADEGYFDPSDLPFDMKVVESVEVNEAGMNDPVLMAFRAAKMKREKELAKPKRKPLYGKQREAAEDQLWQISMDLKDLYSDRGQMLIDMEQEAEAEGGPIADEYGDKLNKIEDEIQNLIAKRSQLEIRLAESVVNEDVNEGRSINKIQKDWGKITSDMKVTVDAWKAAEGKDKDQLLAKLKDLTAQKKKLEAELDSAVSIKDIDAELVGESIRFGYYYFPKASVDSSMQPAKGETKYAVICHNEVQMGSNIMYLKSANSGGGQNFNPHVISVHDSEDEAFKAYQDAVKYDEGKTESCVSFAYGTLTVKGSNLPFTEIGGERKKIK